jgi:hypothetical protein
MGPFCYSHIIIVQFSRFLLPDETDACMFRISLRGRSITSVRWHADPYRLIGWTVLGVRMRECIMALMLRLAFLPPVFQSRRIETDVAQSITLCFHPKPHTSSQIHHPEKVRIR